MNISFDMLQLLSSNVPNGAWQLVSIKKYWRKSYLYLCYLRASGFLLTFLASPWKIAFEMSIVPNSCRELLCNGWRPHQLCAASFSFLPWWQEHGWVHWKCPSVTLLFLGEILDYLQWITFFSVCHTLSLGFNHFSDTLASDLILLRSSDFTIHRHIQSHDWYFLLIWIIGFFLNSNE